MVSALAEATGRGTQGLVSQYINGKIPLNYRALMLFARELGCDPRDIRKDLPEQTVTSHKTDTDDPEWPNIIGVRVAAALGEGVEPDEYAETHKLKFRAESLARKKLDPAQLAVVYGKGESMYPTIKDGDAILFDRRDTEPRDGKLYVVTYDRGLCAKRLTQLGGRWFLESDNRNDAKWHKPVLIDEVKGFEIHGRVRWIGSWED